jgi:DNA-binding MarR family transcriptional regulator
MAEVVGRDKTRLIHPVDRRNRIVELNDAGRALLGSCRQAIRAMEKELLDTLEPAERATFLTALERLAKAAAETPPPP